MRKILSYAIILLILLGKITGSFVLAKDKVKFSDYWQVIRQLEDKKKYWDAIGELENILFLFPNYKEIYYHLALDNFKVGRAQVAAVWLAAVLKCSYDPNGLIEKLKDKKDIVSIKPYYVELLPTSTQEIMDLERIYGLLGDKKIQLSYDPLIKKQVNIKWLKKDNCQTVPRNDVVKIEENLKLKNLLTLYNKTSDLNVKYKIIKKLINMKEYLLAIGFFEELYRKYPDKMLDKLQEIKGLIYQPLLNISENSILVDSRNLAKLYLGFLYFTDFRYDLAVSTLKDLNFSKKEYKKIKEFYYEKSLKQLKEAEKKAKLLAKLLGVSLKQAKSMTMKNKNNQSIIKAALDAKKCKEIKLDLEEAVRLYNIDHLVPMKGKVDVIKLIKEGYLKPGKEYKCPSGGTYYIKNDHDVYCSIHN